MKTLTNLSELSEIIREYLKNNKITSYNFAKLLGKDPAYLSRVLNNKHEVSADMMLTLLKSMGYEVVLMTKKERNLFEKGAYAELSKEMGNFREEIREGVISEIEVDLMKNLANYFRKNGHLKVEDKS